MLRMLILAAVALAAPAVLLMLGGAWAAIMAGVASWAIAVACKPAVYRLLHKVVPSKSTLSIAVQVGLASGALELGFGGIYLWLALPSLSVLDVVAFGGAVGAAEVFFVIGMAVVTLRCLQAGAEQRAGRNDDSSAWNWTSPRTAVRFYGFIGLVGCLELALFLVMLPR